MPAWWGKKSTKRNAKDPKSLSPNSPSSLKNELTERRERPKSFGELSGMEETRNSTRASRDFPSARGSSGFSGFDSPSSMDRGHPLLEPSVSPSSVGNDHEELVIAGIVQSHKALSIQGCLQPVLCLCILGLEGLISILQQEGWMKGRVKATGCLFHLDFLIIFYRLLLPGLLLCQILELVV
ncbi:unnamed protein product [Cuscuta campestris]|uniref:Uncharacterized protein n=1 Tax=Cuscuta campestris TaxID=132261 RepID=A0A484NLR0_9ASTE|nr:unnamed protein product [Cuscuta campestris]